MRRGFPASFESLEDRALLATVSVDPSQVVRPVDTQLLGVNLVWWDSSLNTAQTQQMVQAAGLNNFRFPGGSSSDDFHFNDPPSYNGKGTDTSMASFAAAVNGQGIVTLDYGSGSPQEAAALLAYLNGSVNNNTPIGTGQEWSDTANAWQTVDWKTAGYWASLRAATPLVQDDGLNFLRVGRTAPFGFKYFEVGNEEYGSWEVDHHAVQHDPTTYVGFAKQFAGYAAQIDPTISIGVDAGGPGADFNNWMDYVLKQSAAQGFVPGFISDHSYMQAPGSETDSNLLFNTVTAAGNVENWTVRGAQYQNLLAQDLGTAGKNVELLATEFNSVYSSPGKQTTSLVNGLFVADALGVLLQSPYDGADVWDLRNSFDTGNNNSASLYGWRQGGDYGLLGSPGTAPATGTYVPYPSYFAEQLASKVIQAGGSVVQASSNDPNLDTFAVLEPNGHLGLLVINKSASGAVTGQFQLGNFQPAAQAQVWQYGEAEDTAQSQTADGHSALTSSTANLTLNGSSFSYSFPAYSMTVLDLGPASGVSQIVDNSSPGFSSSGSWTPAVGYGGINNNVTYTAGVNGPATATATWQATGLPAGTYNVDVTWVAGTNRATNAPYQIYDGNMLLATVPVNQQLAPSGVGAAGATFQSLGSFSVASGTLKVVLGNNANGYVVADAIRVVTPASVPAVVDDGGPGASQSGTWTLATGYGGYNNAYRYAAPWGGAATASWTVSDLAPGAYDVEVTWGAGSNRADNAPYQVYDGNTLLATINVNQRLAPSGPAAGGVAFQSLGAFNITSGALRVVLSNNADGYVIADAMRVAPLPPPVVTDNHDAGYAQTGSWTNTSIFGGYTGGYGGDYNFAAPTSGGTSTATASWAQGGLAPGRYDVEVTWVAGTNRATNAPYQIYDGNTLLASVLVNQQIAPSGPGAGGVAFQSLGTYNVTSGTLRVVLANTANGYVIADAMRLAAPTALPAVFDNGGSGFAEVGPWSPASGYGGYANAYDFAAAGDGSTKATWTASGLLPQSYRVEVTWGAGSNRATNAPYQIYDGNTLLATVNVNQQLAPSGPTAGGVAFQSLGLFNITSGSLRVVLSNNANGYVIADAVRLVSGSLPG